MIRVFPTGRWKGGGGGGVAPQLQPKNLLIPPTRRNYHPNKFLFLPPPHPHLIIVFMLSANKNFIFSFRHCFCTITLFAHMLILIFIEIQFLRNVVFTFEKGSNGQNHSSSDSHRQIK